MISLPRTRDLLAVVVMLVYLYEKAQAKLYSGGWY